MLADVEQLLTKRAYCSTSVSIYLHNSLFSSLLIHPGFLISDNLSNELMILCENGYVCCRNSSYQLTGSFHSKNQADQIWLCSRYSKFRITSAFLLTQYMGYADHIAILHQSCNCISFATLHQSFLILKLQNC